MKRLKALKTDGYHKIWYRKYPSNQRNSSENRNRSPALWNEIKQNKSHDDRINQHKNRNRNDYNVFYACLSYKNS